MLTVRLSSLGVKVLDSEEVERNIMDQAKSLSERSGPEYLECRGKGFSVS